MIAEQLVGPDYALHLLFATAAAQQLAVEWTEATKQWSPPLTLDLSKCSIDCADEYIQIPK